jgi:hypothetical protein
MYERPSVAQKLLSRFVYGLGILTLLVIVAAILTSIYAYYLAHVLERPAEVYANDSIRAIIMTWSEDELIKRSSAEFRAGSTQGQLDHIFDTLRKLGKFQSYQGLERSRPKMTYLINQFTVMATLRAKATYEKGRIEVTITIIHRGPGWQIKDFDVDTSSFE